jgi:hypothetical protein
MDDHFQRRRLLRIGLPLSGLAGLLWTGAGHALSFGAVRGSGTVQREMRSVKPFSALRLGGSMAAELRHGEQPQVELEADDNLLPLIELRLDDTTLVVSEKESMKPTRRRIVVTTPSLDSLHLGGSAALRCEGWSAARLTLKCGGSASVKLQGLKLQTLFAELGGSSQVSAEGEVDELTAVLGGSAGLRAGRLQARRAALQAGGSSQSTLWVQQRLQAALSGSSGLRYHGQPPVLDTTKSGAATVKDLGDGPGR